MKKILLIIFMLFAFFGASRISYAATFVEGKYISGEYIAKDKDGVHYYATMQFIKDENGNIVYCLEPFVDFYNNGNYDEVEFSNYNKLNADQKRRIELLAYYGYGYGDRTDEKWYAITQYLIWNTVDTKAKFYFTSTLNGTKVEKYREDIIALESDADNHDYDNVGERYYHINYKEDLYLPLLDNKKYEIVESSYKYEHNDNGLSIYGIEDSGKIYYKKISNYYQDKIRIYDSSNNQDLIKPGNVENYLMSIEVEVEKATIVLDILKDDSVYTVESDMTNTCYEILSFDSLLETVCTSDNDLYYETEFLHYGEYTVRQISHGVGYKADDEVYTFTLDWNNTRQVVTLNNLLIRNNIEIEKYACKDDICLNESDAIFEVRDKNGDLVDKLVTNSEGYSFLTVGYGTYTIEQVQGIDGYDLASEYREKIVDETTSHQKTLYNRFIVNEPDDIEEIEEIEDVAEDVILPPKTGVELNIIDLLMSLIFNIKEMFVHILALLS